MNGRKQVPVGTSDFKEIVSEYYYIDKSLLIKDILDIKSKVYLFSRPRRFGKTSNMSMLKCFFEKTKEDTASYFKDLKIWQQSEEYRKEQGRHPVIFLTLKDIKCNSWEVTLRKIGNVIQKAFLYFEQDLDEPFRQYFGFTQEEVEKLAEDYACKEKLAEIKEFPCYDWLSKSKKALFV